MINCERCGEDVKFLTKTTGNCLRCSVEEMIEGEEFAMDEDDPELAGSILKSSRSVRQSLIQEGYGDAVDVNVGDIDRLYNYGEVVQNES